GLLTKCHPRFLQTRQVLNPPWLLTRPCQPSRRASAQEHCLPWSLHVSHDWCHCSNRKARPFPTPHLAQWLPKRYLNDSGYYGGSEMPQLNTLFHTMEKNYSNWVRNFAPAAVTVSDKAAVAEFEQSLGRMNPKVAVDVAKAVFLGDLRRVLPEVTVPCSVIQSREDLFVPEFVGHYMQKNLGGAAKVQFLKAQGHFPQLTAHRLLLKALKKLHLISGIKKCSPSLL
ncbi:unnamed protein product, partial [Linum tenue]